MNNTLRFKDESSLKWNVVLWVSFASIIPDDGSKWNSIISFRSSLQKRFGAGIRTFVHMPWLTMSAPALINFPAHWDACLRYYRRFNLLRVVPAGYQKDMRTQASVKRPSANVCSEYARQEPQAWSDSILLFCRLYLTRNDLQLLIMWRGPGCPWDGVDVNGCNLRHSSEGAHRLVLLLLLLSTVSSNPVVHCPSHHFYRSKDAHVLHSCTCGGQQLIHRLR